MKVVYIITHANCSGPVNQALNILTGLNRIEGVHASLMTLEPEPDGRSWLQRFRDNHIDIVQLDLPKWNIPACVSHLKKYIKGHSINVVHSSGYKADIINMLVRKYVVSVSTQRCLPTEVAEKFPKHIRPILEKGHLSVINQMDKVVACSKSLQKVFTEQYGMNVIAVQNAVNTDFFIPVDKDKKNVLRDSLGLPDKKTIYLVLGSLRERKNVGLIIDAFMEMDNQDILLLIVGMGPDYDTLTQKASDDDRIIFTGMTSKPLDYLQASDYLVSSALAEGLPNTVLEALSCGLVPILSDIEPHKELVEGTSVEHIFNRYSKEELKLVLAASLSWDMVEQSKMARQLAVDMYGIDSLARKYMDVYTTCSK